MKNKVSTKTFLLAGLLAVLGLRAWYPWPTGNPPQPPKISIMKDGKGNYRYHDTIKPPFIECKQYTHSAGNEDEYIKYVHSLKVVPPNFYGDPVLDGLKHDCNRTEIRRIHDQIEEHVSELKKELKKESNSALMHAEWNYVGDLITLDKKLANCSYRNDERRYKQLWEEIAGHHLSLNRFSAAAEAYCAAGDTQKAKEYFLRDIQRSNDSIGFSAEKLIEITPTKELSELVTTYLQWGDLLNAGKVEWVRGNDRRARELIIWSPTYQIIVSNIQSLIQKGDYWQAVRKAWGGARVPFYRDILKELCVNNPACIDELNNFYISEDFQEAVQRRNLARVMP